MSVLDNTAASVPTVRSYKSSVFQSLGALEILWLYELDWYCRKVNGGPDTTDYECREIGKDWNSAENEEVY